MMSSKNVLKIVGTSVISAAVASGITWYVTNKILTEQYEERLDEEVKITVKRVLENSGFGVVVSDEDPDILAEQLNKEEQPVEIVLPEAEPSADFDGDVERVFGAQQTEKPPLEDLAELRHQKVQYNKILTDEKYDETTEVKPEDLPEPPPENPDISVISRDIFMENGSEWEQDTLTYFADGGVLDGQSNFVENHEELIGEGRPRFGEMSEDANVVYVRNKKLEKEFEIISDPGNASEFLAHSLEDIYKPSWKT